MIRGLGSTASAGTGGGTGSCAGDAAASISRRNCSAALGCGDRLNRRCSRRWGRRWSLRHGSFICLRWLLFVEPCRRRSWFGYLSPQSRSSARRNVCWGLGEPIGRRSSLGCFECWLGNGRRFGWRRGSRRFRNFKTAAHSRLYFFRNLMIGRFRSRLRRCRWFGVPGRFPGYRSRTGDCVGHTWGSLTRFYDRSRRWDPLGFGDHRRG